MQLRVTYDGPILDNYEMDIRDLAPSLMALADFFEAGSQAVYGNQLRMTVRVRASFRTGSFGIDLSLAVNSVGQLLDFFSSRPSTGTLNLMQFVMYLMAYIAFQRRRAGQAIKQIERQGDDFFVILEDGSQLPIEQMVLRLLQSRTVAEHFAKVLEPLRRDGINQVAFGNNKEVQEVVKKEELPYFAPMATAAELLTEEERKTAYSLVTVAFKEDNKWRVSDGQTTFFVAMEDQGFLSRVEEGERFGKGDLLICNVRVLTWQTENGLRTEYFITKVLEHRLASEQMRFPFPESPSVVPGPKDPPKE